MRGATSILVLLLLPGASAEAVLHGRLLPTTAQATVAAGEETTLPFTWRVDFEGTTCTSAVEVGVDFFVDDAPTWAGADFEPDGSQTRYPGGEGTTVLEVLVDDDAPVGAGGTVLLALELNPFNGAGACDPVPVIRTEGASAVVHVAPGPGATQDSTTPAPSTHGRSPGPGALLLLGTLLALVAGRRR